MTVIVVAGRSMAADSMCFTDTTREHLAPGKSKIVRLPDGTLFGVAGFVSNMNALQEWAAAGMDFANPPTLRREDNDLDGPLFVWLRPDGRCFIGYMDMTHHETTKPYGIGAASAWRIALGALCAGAPLKQAMTIAIEHCIWVGGDVHLLTLDAPAESVSVETPQIPVKDAQVPYKPKVVNFRGLDVEVPALPRIPGRY